MRCKLRPELRQKRSRQHDTKCRLKSSQINIFNHLSQGNSTNYYIMLLGPRKKAAPPTSQQVDQFRPKRVSIDTVIHFYFFLIHMRDQPTRGNVHQIGRMFPEHVERRFLDPEYSLDEYFQLGSRRNVGPIKNQLVSPKTSN